MKQTFICQQCGKEYTSYKPNSQHCSRECQKIYRESQKKKYNCDYCGKEIIIKRCEYEALKNGIHHKNTAQKNVQTKVLLLLKRLYAKIVAKSFTVVLQ